MTTYSEKEALKAQRVYIRNEIIICEADIRRTEDEIVRLKNRLYTVKGISAILEKIHYAQLNKCEMDIENSIYKLLESGPMTPAEIERVLTVIKIPGSSIRIAVENLLNQDKAFINHDLKMELSKND